jgi:CheY-specific phosphatase CheX
MTAKSNGVLEPITQRTISFLADEMGIELQSREFELQFPNKIELYPYTAMIGIGASLSFMFTMSFENNALERLTRAFIYGEISDDEMETMKESVACEVANTVLGNSIPNFPNKGAGVTITPPVMVECGKSISKNTASIIATVAIKTESGRIILAIISPEILSATSRSPQ